MKILEDVKSPFTDELIKYLIEKYIACGCDDNLFYRGINELEKSENSTDSFTNELIRRIYSQGVDIGNSWHKGDDDTRFIYDSNNSWVQIYSEDDAMQQNKRREDKKRPLVYRIYLNLRDKDKLEFVEDYIKKCQDRKMPFEFKFSKDSSRKDQIVILSRMENFEENVAIVEELTQSMQLGKIPMLIGEYKSGIGIAEEYYNRLYSPTKAKLALVRSSVKKYLCDHIDEFESQLSDEEKKKINAYISDFNYLYESEKEDIEEFGDEYEDLGKSYYQEKSTIDCAEEHIENDHDAYVCGTGLLELGNAIKQIYSNNPEQFISEIAQNFRMIGTQVWGFAQDLLFSNETEDRFLGKEEKEEALSAEQIGSELGRISREGLVTDALAGLTNSIEPETQKTMEE